MFMNIAKYHIFIYKKRVNFCPPVEIILHYIIPQ